MKSFVLALCFLLGSISASAFAQSAYDYASRMNNGRFFRHDRSWGGAEVIYQSSGTATRADAMRWWMNSPPHRRLIQSGQITDIACVGNVCVGRSGGGGQAYNQNVANSGGEMPVVYTSMGGGATTSDPGITTMDSGCDSCNGGQSYGGSRRGILRRVFRR
jgi:hypothetical protein